MLNNINCMEKIEVHMLKNKVERRTASWAYIFFVQYHFFSYFSDGKQYDPKDGNDKDNQ